MAKRVLELHQLDEEIVLGIQTGRGHRALEVKRKPFLDPAHTRALRKIHEQRKVEHDRRGEYRVAAQKVDLDLHRITQPAEDINVVPTLFVVATGRIIVDPHYVAEVFVERRVDLRLEDVFEDRELRLLFGLE